MGKRVLSGMRPTGPLHIGHWEGVLKNWVTLQQEHECFFFSADWHVLTTDYERASDVGGNVVDNVADWIACGLDPGKSVLFVQSDIKEHAELYLLLSMLVPVPWLERNPTYKEQLRELRRTHVPPPLVQKIAKELKSRAKKPLGERLQAVVATPEDEDPAETLMDLLPELEKSLPKDLYERIKQAATARDLSTLGFLSYPVLQTADIIIYKGDLVPVGEDQMPHIELSRDIVRRFNSLYGETFPEPRGLLTPTPRLLGTDERKMSKSYDNAVFLGDSAEDTVAKIKPMQTDPARRRLSDPGDPDKCNVFSWHKLYSGESVQSECARKCRAAAFGCMDCKMILAENLNAALAPIREKRAGLLEERGKIERIIEGGAEKARAVARATIREVREAMKIHG